MHEPRQAGRGGRARKGRRPGRANLFTISQHQCHAHVRVFCPRRLRIREATVVFAREALMSHGRISAPVRTPNPAGPSPRATECKRTTVSKARNSRHTWAFDSGNRCRKDNGNRVSAKVTARAGSFLSNSSSIAARIRRSRGESRMSFLHPFILACSPATRRRYQQIIGVGGRAATRMCAPSRADAAATLANRSAGGRTSDEAVRPVTEVVCTAPMRPCSAVAASDMATSPRSPATVRRWLRAAREHVPVDPRQPLCGRRAGRASPGWDDGARRRRHPPVPRIRTFRPLAAHFTVPGGYPISGCHPWWVVRRLRRAEDGGGVEEHPRGAPCPTISITTSS